ncbi:MAG: hypothetical protein RSG77_18125 [Hafnia sp.]
MNARSTYECLGIPESLAITITLVSLALTLAPWIEGTQIGPLNIPKIKPEVLKPLKVIAPMILFLTFLGFPKLCHVTILHNKNENPVQDVAKKEEIGVMSYEDYMEVFFDTRNAYFRGEPYPLKEIESRHYKESFSDTCWYGGSNWGDIMFNNSGRIGQYTNLNGRSQGKIILQGTPAGTIPLIIGEWIQQDGQKGRLIIDLPPNAYFESLEMRWGPNFTLKNIFRRKLCQ